MGLLTVFVGVAVMLLVDKVVTRRGKYRRAEVVRTVLMPRAGAAAVTDATEEAIPSSEEAERVLTARLLTGELGHADYQASMAALAATAEQVGGR
ncbi:MAG TPA: hypothetical protein VH333_09615 [Pseudonocardiaceae bacterium]|jgi:hypothetical protein|nr:hypothetical protein [Pseudonocardiaceae bacterium]